MSTTQTENTRTTAKKTASPKKETAAMKKVALAKAREEAAKAATTTTEGTGDAGTPPVLQDASNETTTPEPNTLTTEPGDSNGPIIEHDTNEGSTEPGDGTALITTTGPQGTTTENTDKTVEEPQEVVPYHAHIEYIYAYADKNKGGESAWGHMLTMTKKEVYEVIKDCPSERATRRRMRAHLKPFR